MAQESFMYRDHLQVSRADLVAASEGRKTCTSRRGIAGVASPEIDLTDGRDRLRVRIVKIDLSKTLANLGDAEVRGEGFRETAELEADLRRYYRDITMETPLTIIWFEPLSKQ